MTHFLPSFLRIHHYLCFITSVNTKSNNPLSILQTRTLQKKLFITQCIKFISNHDLSFEWMKVFVWMLTLKFSVYAAVLFRIQCCVWKYFIQLFCLNSFFEILLTIEWRCLDEAISFIWTRQKCIISSKSFFIVNFNNISNFDITRIYLFKFSIFKNCDSLTVLFYYLKHNKL